MLGLEADWDRFQEEVLLSDPNGQADALLRADMGSIWSGFADRVHRNLPLQDISGSTVGRISVGIDMSQSRAQALNSIAYLTALIATALITLIVFLRLIATRTETRLMHALTERADYERRSRIDQLTHLYNQTEFYRLLDLEIERCRRQQLPLSLIMLDIDSFKAINDEHGHRVGDCVLHSVALELQTNTRTGDHLARYGGEEFTVILPDTPVEVAHEIAERWRSVISGRVFVCHRQSVRVTISLGVACYPQHAVDAKTLLQQADLGMYAAKRKGRNRVEIHTPRQKVGERRESSRPEQASD